MEVGGSGAAAGQDERIERTQGGIHLVDLALEPRDLRRDDAQCPRRLVPWRAPPLFRRAQIGAQIEQIVLDARQHLIGLAVGMKPRQSDSGIGFVDGAKGRDAQRLLGHAGAVAERSFARVAAARVDAGEPHHQRWPASSINSASTRSATPCMTTRACMNRLERRGLPPRIIVATPMPRTPKTPSMASTRSSVRNVVIAAI